MKDVWPVTVDVNPPHIFRIAISGEMVTFLDQQAFCTRIGHLPSKDRTEQACSHDHVVVHCIDRSAHVADVPEIHSYRMC